MRHGSSNRRQRNRGNGGRRNNQQRTQVFDSNGPDVRIRGTAHQVCEKYMALAKDALSSGDRIMAESYFQHAEHYQRIINGFEEKSNAKGEDSSSQKSDAYNAKEQDNIGNRADDDLGLPESITGGSSKAAVSEAQQAEVVE